MKFIRGTFRSLSTIVVSEFGVAFFAAAIRASSPSRSAWTRAWATAANGPISAAAAWRSLSVLR